MGGGEEPIVKSRRMSPLSIRMQQDVPQFMSRATVADMLGVSPNTVTRLAEQCKGVPTRMVEYGTLHVGCYTTKDVETLQKLLDEQRAAANPNKPGAPKRYTKAQLAERLRLRQRIHYHRQAMRQKGPRTKAGQEHKAKIAEFQQALDNMKTLQQKALERKNRG